MDASNKTSVLNALTLFDKLLEKIARECRAPTEKEKEALDRALELRERAARSIKLPVGQALPDFT